METGNENKKRFFQSKQAPSFQIKPPQQPGSKWFQLSQIKANKNIKILFLLPFYGQF